MCPMTGQHIDPVKAAVNLARRAHDGHLDKGGQPVPRAPLRVMRAMSAEERWQGRALWLDLRCACETEGFETSRTRLRDGWSSLPKAPSRRAGS